MLEYIRDYFSVKNGEFDKSERDLIAVTLKKIVTKPRKAIALLEHLQDQQKLQRYSENIKTYNERLKEELKVKLVEIVQMLQSSALPNAKNVESKAFFLNLIGDFCRYQVEMITAEDFRQSDNTVPSIQKKAKRDRDMLLQRASDFYFDGFK